MLPEAITEVVIVADNDTDNDLAGRLLDRAMARLVRAGRRVRIAHPPAGVKDMNELLCMP